MSLIEHHYRLLGELFGYQVSYLRVQQVMVAVHHNVSMQDLRGSTGKRRTRISHKTKEPTSERNSSGEQLYCHKLYINQVTILQIYQQIFFTSAVRGKTYRVACQIVGTPAFPPAKVLQVVQVVDAGRKRHLTADCVKLLHAQIRMTGVVQGNKSCSHTDYKLHP